MIRGISFISMTSKGAKALEKVHEDAMNDTPENKNRLDKQFKVTLTVNKNHTIMDLELTSLYRKKIIDSMITMKRFGLRLDEQTTIMGYIDRVKNEVMKQLVSSDFTIDYNTSYIEG